MYSAKVFTVEGVNVTYLLRRVQHLFNAKEQVPEVLTTALQQCQTTEQLLDFFFTTDFRVDEAFIHQFEKRLQEVECPF
ncbi:MAG TPA: hypothetical protein VGN63_22995 [Flavisolibacter sp.]|jgi:hypothetical protein|nr:hypothetical protein [Flavisolibacter sp.]